MEKDLEKNWRSPRGNGYAGFDLLPAGSLGRDCAHHGWLCQGRPYSQKGSDKEGLKGQKLAKYLLTIYTPLAYNHGGNMKFIETSVFTRLLEKHLDDDSYRLLQHTLMLRPDMGNLIQGSGGLRKVRWKSKGRGKSGGARIIYYWAVSEDTILMLLVYGKNEQANLTPAQLGYLRKIIEEEYS